MGGGLGEDGKSPRSDFNHQGLFDIHDIANKSGVFSPALMENKINERNCVKGISYCHVNAVFDAMFGEILPFWLFFLQILAKHFKQLVIFSLEINYGILLEHNFLAPDL